MPRQPGSSHDRNNRKMNGHDCSNKTLFTKTGTGPDLAWEPPPPPPSPPRNVCSCQWSWAILGQRKSCCQGDFHCPQRSVPIDPKPLSFCLLLNLALQAPLREERVLLLLKILLVIQQCRTPTEGPGPSSLPSWSRVSPDWTPGRHTHREGKGHGSRSEEELMLLVVVRPF